MKYERQRGLTGGGNVRKLMILGVVNHHDTRLLRHRDPWLHPGETEVVEHVVT